tara:strand:- start:25793 stop:26041 length:249 start_codon:yes stop_codon:yes gene_type:complete
LINRWGREIAQLNSITDSWDGTDKGGNDVPDGVYFYTYNAILANSTAFNGQGTVTLLLNRAGGAHSSSDLLKIGKFIITMPL